MPDPTPDAVEAREDEYVVLRIAWENQRALLAEWLREHERERHDGLVGDAMLEQCHRTTR